MFPIARVVLAAYNYSLVLPGNGRGFMLGYSGRVLFYMAGLDILNKKSALPTGVHGTFSRPLIGSFPGEMAPEPSARAISGNFWVLQWSRAPKYPLKWPFRG